MSHTLIRPDSLTTRPRGARGSYYVHTWGCQMNVEDSEQIGLFLEGMGFDPARTPAEADVILLNTCSVRKKPEDKAFSMLGEIAELKLSRPGLIVGVCGCMAQIRADEIRRRNPCVDFVVGTGQIVQIPGLVEEAAQSRRFAKRLELPPRRGSVVTDVPLRAVGREAKLKAFVPIQYGCDKFCTFCIVPATRGRERSRPTEEIVAEVRELVLRGTREITLLGQTVNSYGKNLAEGRVPFSKLLEVLAEIPNLERIRYTSPYPRDFTDDLVQTIRDCPKVMEHCHLPLQSGHDGVLKRMRRLYSVDGFLSIVDRLRRAVPDISLTTDIIVGFPEESDDEFEATMELVRAVRFDGAFMFAYSPRPGTPAAGMKQVPAPTKKERLQRLIDLQNGISCERNQSAVGRTFEVLVEGPSPKEPDNLQGYSREFKMFHFPGQAPRGSLVPVRAEEAHLWGLRGSISKE